MGILRFIAGSKDKPKVYTANSWNHAKQLKRSVINNNRADPNFTVTPITRTENPEALPLMFQLTIKNVKKNAQTS